MWLLENSNDIGDHIGDSDYIYTGHHCSIDSDNEVLCLSHRVIVRMLYKVFGIMPSNKKMAIITES